MQSGITASEELQQAFSNLLSDTSLRGLLVGIKDEKLVPTQTIPSTSPNFESDLSILDKLIKDNEAAYVILRRYADSLSPFVLVTYVPDLAHVRQKMLVASTRLTLSRELGTEKFKETLFVTSKRELTADGFGKHDKHVELKAPLTEEEESLQDIKQAEAEASVGTSSRSSHTSSGVNFPLTDEALQALKGLEEGGGNLVQLKLDIQRERVDLAATTTTDADGLATAISDQDPRYSFFRYSHDFEGKAEVPILFIYTCPTGSKVKERMLYASCRGGVIVAAGDAGLTIAKKMEATSPLEITGTTIEEEFHPKREEKVAFSRPKRPGRR
ncbi:MAG: Twinfilin-1 [Geoglossum umbratile]|nr:MAG: Twinfilin-1 [Geoglossum umbratile]